MGKIIYLEGIDGSGKSTLIQKLIKKYENDGVLYYHNGLYKSSLIAYANYRKQLIEAISFTGVTILDRGFLAEEIYGMTYRNKSEVDMFFLELEKNFIDQNTTLIWCNPPYENSYNNWASRLADEAFNDGYRLLWANHQLYLNNTKLNKINYDYTKGEFDFDLL